VPRNSLRLGIQYDGYCSALCIVSICFSSEGELVYGTLTYPIMRTSMPFSSASSSSYMCIVGGRYTFSRTMCCVMYVYIIYIFVTQTTRYMCCTCVCVVYIYVQPRYLCARAIRVPAGCARGGGGDGDGGAWRRVNEMFSRG